MDSEKGILENFANMCIYTLRQWNTLQFAYSGIWVTPKALLIDTFMHTFPGEVFYAFPPFNMINRFLGEVDMEGLEGIIIVPCRSTQPFLPLLLSLLIKYSVMIKWRIGLLSNPNWLENPIGKRIRMIYCHISGRSSQRREFLKVLSKQCTIAGLVVHNDNITLILNDRNIFVQNLIIHQMVRLWL